MFIEPSACFQAKISCIQSFSLGESTIGSFILFPSRPPKVLCMYLKLKLNNLEKSKAYLIWEILKFLI